MSIKLDNGFRGSILCELNTNKQKKCNVNIINDYIMMFSFDRNIPIYDGEWNPAKNCYIVNELFFMNGSYKKYIYNYIELKVISIIHRYIIVKEYEVNNFEVEQDEDTIIEEV